jgi:hypothetical protein
MRHKVLAPDTEALYDTGMTSPTEFEMVRLPSHEVQRQWGRIQDIALVEPVTVTSKGRDRQVMLPADFSEADIEALEKAQAPLAAHAFDDEVRE